MKYIGFGKRAFAQFVDFLITAPFGLSILVIVNYQRIPAIILFASSTLAVSLYPIACTAIWGRTLGKQIVKIEVVKFNSLRCGWREGFLRYIIPISVQIVVITFITLILIKAPQNFFDSTSYAEKIGALNYSTKHIFQIANVILFLWLLIDLIIFFSNNKHRACHDLIAGTVVVNVDNIEIDKNNTDDDKTEI